MHEVGTRNKMLKGRPVYREEEATTQTITKWMEHSLFTEFLVDVCALS